MLPIIVILAVAFLITPLIDLAATAERSRIIAKAVIYILTLLWLLWILTYGPHPGGF